VLGVRNGLIDKQSTLTRIPRLCQFSSIIKYCQRIIYNSIHEMAIIVTKLLAIALVGIATVLAKKPVASCPTVSNEGTPAGEFKNISGSE
jgi:hypothetical protein